ncbi:MAG TPA: 6-pyruvoyl-tetrahydropterin synthase-related protein [Patescibacteria group bacterium]|nr:6-pyruvoyl-tetrahydropterin synthase-related protein [Patescibacteria group bacterium]
MKTSTRKLLLEVALVLLLGIPAVWALVPPGFFFTHDVIHVARIFAMDKILLTDLQMPPRWVDVFRYGEPTFSFYAPLPYIFGAFIHRIGLTFLDTTKLLFGLGILLSGVSMYFFAKDFFGKKGGYIAAVLYMYAPYHAVDVYVRGALSESWALVFFPLIFWTSYNCFTKKSYLWFLGTVFSLTGLFLTHNIMTLLFTPFLHSFWFFLFFQSRAKFTLIKKAVGSFVLSFLVSSFFLLPAFIEKSFVQNALLTGQYFDFRGHFVAIGQFFRSTWGYGGSVWGPEDGFSLQLGIVHIVLGGLSVLVALLSFRKQKKLFFLLSVFAAFFIVSLFMQHNKSTPIWLQIELLSFVQFPWRFLGLSIFFLSFLAGSIVHIPLPRKVWLGVFFLILTATIFINTRYFHPERREAVSDADYVSSRVLSQEKNLPKDYLPIWVEQIPGERIEEPFSRDGTKITSTLDESTSTRYVYTVEATGSADVVFPVTYFPGWEASIDTKTVPLKPSEGYGLIELTLPEGISRVDLALTETPVRMVGDIGSIIGLTLCALLRKKYEKYFAS